MRPIQLRTFTDSSGKLEGPVLKTNKRVNCKNAQCKTTNLNQFSFKQCHQQQHHNCYLPQNKWQSVGGVKQTKQLPLIEVENSTIYLVISFCFFTSKHMLLKWLSFFFFFFRLNCLTSQSGCLGQTVGSNTLFISNSQLVPSVTFISMLRRGF